MRGDPRTSHSLPHRLWGSLRSTFCAVSAAWCCWSFPARRHELRVGVLGGCCWRTWRTCPSSDPATPRAPTFSHFRQAVSTLSTSRYRSRRFTHVHCSLWLLDRNGQPTSSSWGCSGLRGQFAFSALRAAASVPLPAPLRSVFCSLSDPFAWGLLLLPHTHSPRPEVCEKALGYGFYPGTGRPADQETRHFEDSFAIHSFQEKGRPLTTQDHPSSPGGRPGGRRNERQHGPEPLLGFATRIGKAGQGKQFRLAGLNNVSELQARGGPSGLVLALGSFRAEEVLV